MAHNLSSYSAYPFQDTRSYDYKLGKCPKGVLNVDEKCICGPGDSMPYYEGRPAFGADFVSSGGPQISPVARAMVQNNGPQRPSC